MALIGTHDDEDGRDSLHETAERIKERNRLVCAVRDLMELIMDTWQHTTQEAADRRAEIVSRPEVKAALEGDRPTWV